MKVEKIIKKLNKNGITNYEIISMLVGCDIVNIRYDNDYELDKISNLFKRGVKIEIDSFIKTVTLWNLKEWKRAHEIYVNMEGLLNIFREELRKGKTREEAKQAQYEYAKQNNIIGVYYLIYQ